MVAKTLVRINTPVLVLGPVLMILETGSFPVLCQRLSSRMSRRFVGPMPRDLPLLLGAVNALCVFCINDHRC